MIHSRLLVATWQHHWPRIERILRVVLGDRMSHWASDERDRAMAAVIEQRQQIERAGWFNLTEARMSKATALLSLLVLGGCAEPVWIRPPQMSQQDFQRHAYECERDAEMLPAMPRPAAPPPTYSGYVSPGGYYTATPRPDPGQGLQDLAAVLGDRARRDSMFERCLEAKGYRKATPEEQERIKRLRHTGRVGLRFEPRDGALIVVAVLPGGPAERAGLRPGDQIVKVGGIPIGPATSRGEITGS